MKSCSEGNRPDFVAKVLKVCDIDSYQNIYVLLKILRTVVVTSCECEISWLVLKRLTLSLNIDGIKPFKCISTDAY